MSSLSPKPCENYDSIMALKNQIWEMFTFWFNANIFLSKYHSVVIYSQLLLFFDNRIFWTLFLRQFFYWWFCVSVINYPSTNFFEPIILKFSLNSFSKPSERTVDT